MEILCFIFVSLISGNDFSLFWCMSLVITVTWYCLKCSLSISLHASCQFMRFAKIFLFRFLSVFLIYIYIKTTSLIMLVTINHIIMLFPPVYDFSWYLWWVFFFKFYLFLVVLGLACCSDWLFSSCGEQGLLSSCDALVFNCCGFSCFGLDSSALA